MQVRVLVRRQFSNRITDISSYYPQEKGLGYTPPMGPEQMTKDLSDVLDKLASISADIVNFASMPGADKPVFLRDIDEIRGILARLKSELRTFGEQEAKEPEHWGGKSESYG